MLLTFVRLDFLCERTVQPHRAEPLCTALPQSLSLLHRFDRDLRMLRNPTSLVAHRIGAALDLTRVPPVMISHAEALRMFETERLWRSLLRNVHGNA